MIFVRIVVGCNDDAISEFASGERLLRLLTLKSRRELNKYLSFSNEKQMKQNQDTILT